MCMCVCMHVGMCVLWIGYKEGEDIGSGLEDPRENAGLWEGLG